MARHEPVWVVREVVLNPCILAPLGHDHHAHDYSVMESHALAWSGYEAYSRCDDFVEYRNTVKAPVAKIVKNRNASERPCRCTREPATPVSVTIVRLAHASDPLPPEATSG